MTNEEIIARVLALDAAGLDMAKLTDDLIAEFQHQEVSYRTSGMGVTHKDRAQLVVRLVWERFVMLPPPLPETPDFAEVDGPVISDARLGQLAAMVRLEQVPPHQTPDVMPNQERGAIAALREEPPLRFAKGPSDADWLAGYERAYAWSMNKPLPPVTEAPIRRGL